MTEDELVKLYDRIYRESDTGEIVHPKVGVLAPYGEATYRDKAFMRFILDKVKPGSRILDASCGRGDLAAQLLDVGYDVEVTEVSPWLVRERLSRRGFAMTHLLTYSQLNQLPVRSFDCVVSNDVLEHLHSKHAAVQAIANLARLSREWFCMSVGLRPARNFPQAMGLNLKSLHTVLQPAKWWRHQFERHASVDFWQKGKRRVFLFGHISP